MRFNRLEVSGGFRGSAETLRVMRALVVEDCTPDMREAAIEAAGYSENPMSQAEMIERWIRTHFVITSENPEILIRPAAALRTIHEKGVVYGDCDDTSMLSAAFLYCLGFDVRFKAIMPAGGVFTHVFTEYRYPPSPMWRPMDCTIPIPPVWSGTYITEVI